MPDQESIFTEDDIKILASFRRSKFWNRLTQALCKRREDLFNEDPQDNPSVWKNRGAIREVQWLLHNAPMLMVQCERWRKAKSPSSVSQDVLSDTETSEIPSGPGTFE